MRRTPDPGGGGKRGARGGPAGAAGAVRLVLASASTARRRLLEEAGYFPEIIPSRARELKGRGMTLVEMVRANARRKALAVARRAPDAVVLAADTAIEVDGRPFGKPRSRAEALAVLLRLAGREHRLATGICVAERGRVRVGATVSRVRLRALPRARLAALLARYDPTAFAGGYSIRRGRDPLVARVTGSRSNVMGLPMEQVAPLLARRLGRRLQ
ncbi:MAG: Maf family protein [Planctomycetes bacterium]|nr:Maf family protein [Planctomycetota bacterium]